MLPTQYTTIHIVAARLAGLQTGNEALLARFFLDYVSDGAVGY